MLACPFASLLLAQVKIDQPVYDRIKTEEMEHSQAMHTLQDDANRQADPLTGRHRGLNRSTVATAAVSWSHFFSSRANCLRPAAVSE